MKCNYQVPQDFRDLTSAETAFHVIKQGSIKLDFKEDNITNFCVYSGLVKCMWEQNMRGGG